jgi:hypothetical protein
MARLRIQGSTGLFGPYSNFYFSTRQEIVKQIYEAYDVVFNEWLAGEYDPQASLKEVMNFDDKAIDLRDVHWTLWNYYPTDRANYNEYWCPGPDDWLKYNTNMTQWPTCDYRSVALPVARPVPEWPLFALPVALPVAIPVLEPIRRVKRHNVRDLEESDLEPVALPVEPVVRRSKRVKTQREFYYGY